ncbi:MULTISPECIES: hypothetical protein [Arthrobacter]|uniref:GGDEF domain-containing protein n=1 Tax=Arthrobacter terricola TaxID=2547396 RepID=A0A4R5K744_9MICC|nr:MULTISPECIES: hypothetical protein [Arthrobacter]MBT8163485.1 hypothetical protein [Arthrobacter sp. GN70]TDF89469.1 hypothetical protein E1809_22950 [Arthrobacter terricola]
MRDVTGTRKPTVSYRIATSAAATADLAAMITAADRALYEAKSFRRNRIVTARAPNVEAKLFLHVTHGQGRVFPLQPTDAIGSSVWLGYTPS